MGQPFGVLCLDLDHFKEVNDTLGHPAGDELLRLVAARLRHCVRDHDLIARLGGDEFAIVVASPAGGPALAASLAARLVESIGAPYEIQGHTIVIGVSIGIALSEPGVSGADMLKRADVALYRAKEERGTFAFFEAGMDELLQARLGMEADLRLALRRDEFELNYQPLYNLAEERVTGFEALIRWNSPTRGRVAPADFIPLAEQTGLIIPIGEWVLRTACAEAARVAGSCPRGGEPVAHPDQEQERGGAGARNTGADRSAGSAAGTGNHRDRAAAGYRRGHDDAAQPA